jgi:hypothetical protein
MGNFINSIYKSLAPATLRIFFKDLRKLSSFREDITVLKRDLLFFRILHYFEHNNSVEYNDELEFLDKIGTLTTYPYNRTNKEFHIVDNGFDKKKGMPFVIHDDKKLYFPKHFSVETAKQFYTNFIVRENILGGGFMEKSPHQYITKSFFVKNDDIVLDIGAGEGLFLLDVIDRIKKGFVFESDKSWMKALTATFEPYKEKVTIINKLVTNKDSINEITIDTCLRNEPGNLFIKMDIEGYEFLALGGAKEVLDRKDDIRVACCTYHKHNDASLLEEFFKDIKYCTEFSDGYMLFASYDKIQPPFFRRGLIRAKKDIYQSKNNK